MKIKIIDIGTKSFEDAYQYQLEKVDELVDKEMSKSLQGVLFMSSIHMLYSRQAW